MHLSISDPNSFKSLLLQNILEIFKKLGYLYVENRIIYFSEYDHYCVYFCMESGNSTLPIEKCYDLFDNLDNDPEIVLEKELRQNAGKLHQLLQSNENDIFTIGDGEGGVDCMYISESLFDKILKEFKMNKENFKGLENYICKNCKDIDDFNYINEVDNYDILNGKSAIEYYNLSGSWVSLGGEASKGLRLTSITDIIYDENIGNYQSTQHCT